MEVLILHVPDLIAGLSTTTLAIIGVCFLALLAFLMALFVRNRKSE
jgi:hypothetical protein